MGNLKELQPIIATDLKRIEHPKGDIFHALKSSENGYVGFGEAYFTTIIAGEVKGWKKHTKMTMNVVVPIGMVRFYVYDEFKLNTTSYVIGSSSYKRLTIPPGYWVAFEGLEPGTNLVLNIASEEHDPGEAENSPLDNFMFE